jgi:two-component system chemotaxis response regulator CheY
MKTLIVEDEPTSRLLLQAILSGYGDCDIATDGEEAVEAFRSAFEQGVPYDLVCMDIMMPKLDGHEALAKIRNIEKEGKVPAEEAAKVIMTTALGDPKNVVKALYGEGAGSYLVKPIGKQKLLEELRCLGLIE